MICISSLKLSRRKPALMQCLPLYLQQTEGLDFLLYILLQKIVENSLVFHSTEKTWDYNHIIISEKKNTKKGKYLLNYKYMGLDSRA